MSKAQQLEDLLDHWETLKEQGQSITPEELCRDCPELLDECRQRVHDLTIIDQFLRGSPEHEEALADIRAGRYRPTGFLARGGLGEVFVAVDEELSREVALKRLQPRQLGDRDSRRRFVLEAEVTGRLEHPGVVPVYGLGRDHKGQPYYAMRLIRGQSLDQAIVDYHSADAPPFAPGERQLTFQKLLRSFLSVCQTISYAHSRGILHRDLKPSNIMLGDYGETLVVDWGLAKVMASSPSPVDAVGPTAASEARPEISEIGLVEGSLGYMSPEQGAGRWDRVGPASDIFALGATLYKLLTARAPYVGSNIVELAEKVKRCDFPPPRSVNTAVPPALEAICLKAMRFDPSERYASAAALAEDIERWLADEPISAWREPLRDRARRWLRRHRTLAIAFVAALGVALAVASAAALLIAGKNTEIAGKNKDLADANRELNSSLQTNQENLYATSIALAYREWANANLDGARRLLDSCPQERRGWEWRYLDRLTHSELKSFDIRLSSNDAATITPNGRWLAVIRNGLDDHPGAHIWDLSTGKEIHDVREARVVDTDWSSVALSPDGRLLATNGGTGNQPDIHVWDVATGKSLWSTQIGEPGPIAFSADSRQLAAASNSSRAAYVFEAQTGKLQHTINIGWEARIGPYSAFQLTFDPSGKLLGLADWGRMASFWNIETGKLAGDMDGHAKVVAFSPNGEQVITADTAVHVWSVAGSAKVRDLFGHTSVITAAAYSPDGRYLATASWDQTVRIWDMTNGREVRTIRGHTAPVGAVAFSDEGRRLVTIGYDGTKVWDITTDQDIRTLKASPSADGVIALAFNNDGTRLATFSGRSAVDIPVWDTTNGSIAATIPIADDRTLKSMALSPDGTLLAAALEKRRIDRESLNNTELKVWDTRTKKERFKFEMKQWDIQSVAFSRGGDHLAAVGREIVSVWDLNNGTRAAKADGDFICIWTAFPPSGNQLLVADQRGWVYRWDWQAKAPLPTFDEKKEFILNNAETKWAFTADGNRVAYTGDLLSSGRVYLKDLTDEKSGHELTLSGHARRVVSLAFSPDGKRLVTTSLDQTVKVWDTTNGKELLTFRGLTQLPNVIAFSPDGSRVAVGCRSLSPGVACDVKVWSAAAK